MNGPRFQHWVPCSYLKQFAINGEIKGRHSHVVVTDRDGSRVAKVAKVGGANWTYSKSRPEVDHEFNVMENDLPQLVESLARGEHLNGRKWLSLFLIMTDLHHRSSAYQNKTSLERFEAYQIISRQWFAEILPSHVEKDDLQAYCDFIHKNWRISLLTSLNGEKFFTSDHPTIIFSDIVDQKPIAVLTPLSPQKYAIAFDATRLSLLSEGISDHDVGLLNGLQVRRCIKELYSDHDLLADENEAKLIQEILAEPRPYRRIEDTIYWPDYCTSGSAGFKGLEFLGAENKGRRPC